eukprot:1117781-Pyramimonas_sp.AAC.1
MFTTLHGVARAGWALVQVDRFGGVVAAAYGPVPFAFGPRQTSRDGEDFAIHMVARVGMPPFDLYFDFDTTLEVFLKGPGSGTSAGAPRGHLWPPFWSSFVRSDYEAHKTLAHATGEDVNQGGPTWWEKRPMPVRTRMLKLVLCCMGSSKNMLTSLVASGARHGVRPLGRQPGGPAQPGLVRQGRLCRPRCRRRRACPAGGEPSGGWAARSGRR